MDAPTMSLAELRAKLNIRRGWRRWRTRASFWRTPYPQTSGALLSPRSELQASCAAGSASLSESSKSCKSAMSGAGPTRAAWATDTMLGSRRRGNPSFATTTLTNVLGSIAISMTSPRARRRRCPRRPTNSRHWTGSFASRTRSSATLKAHPRAAGHADVDEPGPSPEMTAGLSFHRRFLVQLRSKFTAAIKPTAPANSSLTPRVGDSLPPTWRLPAGGRMLRRLGMDSR